MMAAVLLAACVAVQSQPPREARRTQGTASIRGVVLSDESRPVPLRRTFVTLSGTADYALHAITEDDGTFVFAGLPAGRYTLEAAKEGYVAMHYGARRPERPGIGITLREAETRQITLRLPRGGVITGIILDAAGQPVQGVPVKALALRFVGATGGRQFVAAGRTASSSDERGVYRIFGLAAGEYVIAAQPLIAGVAQDEVQPGSAAIRLSSSGAPRAIAPVAVYFPSATDAARAMPVSVGAGEERDGIDVRVDNVPVANITGVVVAPRSAGNAFVGMTRSGDSVVEFSRLTRADLDAQFSFTSVPPGLYTVFAHAGGAFFGSTEIIVEGDDVSNVGISMLPMLSISGRLVFEGRAPASIPSLPSAIPLPVMPPAGRLSLPPPELLSRPGGTFTIQRLTPGIYRQYSRGLGTPVAGWWLKSAVAEGRELLDGPLEIRRSMDDVVVTLSAEASEIAGTLRDPEGAMTANGYVVAFAVDRAAWFFNSRRVTGVRPDAAGRFSIRNLPPGEYCVAAAADLADGEWFDSSVLGGLMAGAVRVVISGAEKQIVNIARIQ